MNKWLAVYAALTLTVLIGILSLGLNKSIPYGEACVVAITLGITYWVMSKLATTAKKYPNRLACLIDRARKDSRYLNKEMGLCLILEKHCAEGKITIDDLDAAKRVITNSIDGYMFLYSYLRANKVIAEGLSMDSPEYRKAANNHWNMLIKQLNQGE